MKAQLRNHVAALLLLAPAAVTLSALPATALAQRASPEVFSFDVQSDGGLQPGARLRFTLQGTPRSQAIIQIRGVRGDIALTETDRGVYTGRYIISQYDRVDENSPVRAFIRRDNVTVSGNYSFPPDINQVAIAPPQGLRIDRFRVVNAERPDPGTEIRFFLDGAPGAQAWVDLPGVANGVALRETRPGHYEGSYTIRRRDDYDPSRQIVATLRRGERTTTSSLVQPIVPAGPDNVPIHILSHSNNGVVDGNVAHVRGRTSPFAHVEVKVDAVPPVIGQFGVAQRVYTQALTADPNGFFEFSFTSPYPVAGTRYDVEMTASKADVHNEARLTLFQRQG
jgi:hypothetical protein